MWVRVLESRLRGYGRTGDTVVAIVAGGHLAVAVAEEAGHWGV